jgi:hypothetical protein
VVGVGVGWNKFHLAEEEEYIILRYNSINRIIQPHRMTYNKRSDDPTIQRGTHRINISR